MSVLVVLEDSTLRSMMANPDFGKAFPFLGLANKPAGTTKSLCCGRARANKNVTDLNTIKARIASLPTPQKAQMKSMLRAQKVRLYFRNSEGKMVKMTF